MVVHGGRARLVRRVEQLDALALAAAIAELDLEGRDAALQSLRQRVVGRMHAGKQRVAAVARDLQAVELRRLADLGVPGAVGVPALAAVEDQLVGLGVRAGGDAHQRDLGILGIARLLHPVRLQAPKRRL